MHGVLLLSLAAASALPSGAGGVEIRIAMAGSSYAPAVIEARVGDTFLFDNNDREAHNVFVPTVAFATDLGKQDPGKPGRLPLLKPGTFEVECVFHQSMIMRVVVKP